MCEIERIGGQKQEREPFQWKVRYIVIHFSDLRSRLRGL